MRKLTEKTKQELMEATETRLKMYKSFGLDLDSKVVADMESKYIIALIEIIDLEECCEKEK